MKKVLVCFSILLSFIIAACDASRDEYQPQNECTAGVASVCPNAHYLNLIITEGTIVNPVTKIYTSFDYGKTFFPTIVEVTPGNYLRSVLSTGRRLLSIVGGSVELILLSEDGGQTVRALNPFPSSLNVRKVYSLGMSDDNIAAIVGNDKGRQSLVLSKDTGNTWVKANISGVTGNLDQMQLSGNNILLSTYTVQGVFNPYLKLFWISKDGGQTFKLISLPGGITIQDFCDLSISGDEVLVLGSVKQKPATGKTPLSNKAEMIQTRNVVPHLYLSKDSGSSFSEIIYDSPQWFLARFAKIEGSDVVIFISNGKKQAQLLVSRDLGNNFIAESIPGNNVIGIEALSLSFNY